LALDTFADISAEETGLVALAVLFGAAGFPAGTAFVLASEFVFEGFSIRVIVVFVEFEVLGVVSIMAVNTMAIFSAFHTRCKTLAVEFHALGVSTIAKFFPFVFL
jgi:hypothetical protein